MRSLLNSDTKLTTESGSTIRVIRLIGSGGQGEVYEIDWSGKRFALKWYYPESATKKQFNTIKNLINQGRPSKSFLWPIELVMWNKSSFGYLMPLREKRFASMIDIIRRKVEPNFCSIATIGYNLADSFLDLHSKGLCYCDISWGNVFLDPSNGDIAICDNDNVIATGERPAVLGTPDFIAPEVVRQEKEPSGETDKFSLSVLLFYLFYIDHPLKGRKEVNIKCFDLDARSLLFGKEPIYIFDENNDSNRPVPGIHDNAIAFQRVYPEFLKRKFEQAFTTGLSYELHSRITENEWKEIMTKLIDAIFYCSNCSSENFFSEQSGNHPQNNSHECWSCGNKLITPFKLRLGKSIIMLNNDSKLYPYHLGYTRSLDRSTVLASIKRHPTDPNIWGLRNDSTENWIATTPSNLTVIVEPNKSVRLTVGTKISFGKINGEIFY